MYGFGPRQVSQRIGKSSSVLVVGAEEEGRARDADALVISVG